MLIRKTKDDVNMNNIWKRITVWQKIVIIILFVMWTAISAGIVLALNGDWVLTIIALCLIWLIYVGVTFILTREKFLKKALALGQET